MSDIPSKVFEREIHQISLREIFEKDENGIYINFDSTIDRIQCNLKYRIPLHQRFNKWNSEAKHNIIDSVYKNYIIGGISFSRHSSDDGDGLFYFDIEDGQSRLTVIQEYLEDKFMYRGKVFSERTEHEKNRFLSYVFSTETMTPSRSARSSTISIEEHHYENFDRINKGASLSDNDKYWCYKNKPMVKFAIELIERFKTECPFMQTQNFGIVKDGKVNRDVLEKICTLVGAIWYDVYKKSYSRHYEQLSIPATNEKKNNVYDFMTHYRNIHAKIYSDVPKESREKLLQFNNPGKFLSLIIRDYKIQRDGVTNQDKVNMWADILNIDRASTNFMKKNYTLYNTFTDGDKKNQEENNIIKRLERIIEFYNDKETISQRYHIEFSPYTDEQDSDSDDD
tara:strand:+ start:9321 stop:10508 length:1188 start_codon:yes stop_codon:yes gene_type:complete